jgi:hypothetical protein
MATKTASKIKNSPNDEQTKYFFERVKYHQTKLNLNNWRIERGMGKATKGTYADISVSWEDRLAIVSLGDDWQSLEINEDSLDSTALHEVLHVFTKSLIYACLSKDTALIESEEHSMVVVLEKLLGKMGQ